MATRPPERCTLCHSERLFRGRRQVGLQARSVTGSALVPSSSRRGKGLRYGFSGHQTFPFRYAWLPKGVSAARRDPEVFSQPDALVRLGVGKNMVASIRFWCAALGLLEMQRRACSLTPLGKLLFGSSPIPDDRNLAPDGALSGADPYLEDPGTLWLLHWQLASRPYPASTWYLAFTCWNESVFTREELARWLSRCARESPASRCSFNSIRRDVDVFLSTYTLAQRRRRHQFEDGFDCPLAELGLIRRFDRGHYAFERGARPSLPDEVLAYALADFWQDSAADQETLPVERVLFGPGSPGAAFKLGDRDMVSILERLPDESGFRYDETAGQRMIFRDRNHNPLEYISKYYKAQQT